SGARETISRRIDHLQWSPDGLRIIACGEGLGSSRSFFVCVCDIMFDFVYTCVVVLTETCFEFLLCYEPPK
ncbi:hypothetical protein VIGAN_10016200, partial [Vigna angularis var. angularis]